MVHHSKDKVPRKLMDMYPQSLVDWIGKNYEVIECKSPVIMDSDGNEGIADGLMLMGYTKNIDSLPWLLQQGMPAVWNACRTIFHKHCGVKIPKGFS